MKPRLAIVVFGTVLKYGPKGNFGHWFRMQVFWPLWFLYCTYWPKQNYAYYRSFPRAWFKIRYP